MEEKELKVKNINAGWYYFLKFYFWFSIIFLAVLIIFGIILYNKFISPNLETINKNWDFFIDVINNVKPLAEEYLNLTI